MTLTCERCRASFEHEPPVVGADVATVPCPGCGATVPSAGPVASAVHNEDPLALLGLDSTEGVGAEVRLPFAAAGPAEHGPSTTPPAADAGKRAPAGTAAPSGAGDEATGAGQSRTAEFFVRLGRDLAAQREATRSITPPPIDEAGLARSLLERSDAAPRAPPRREPAVPRTRRWLLDGVALGFAAAVAALGVGRLAGASAPPEGAGANRAEATPVARVLSTGVYPTADGGGLPYVAGEVHNPSSEPLGPSIEIEVTLRDGTGRAAARARGWAGAVPSPMELHGWSVARAGASLAAAATSAGPLAPGATLPFLVLLPDAAVELDGLALEVSARAGAREGPVGGLKAAGDPGG